MRKKGSFLCLCYIVRAIRAGRCRERRYDHIFIQIYFRMHHFVVKFSKFSSPQAARGSIDSITKLQRTFQEGTYIPPTPKTPPRTPGRGWTHPTHGTPVRSLFTSHKTATYRRTINRRVHVSTRNVGCTDLRVQNAVANFAFSSLTLSIGRQEEHSACKICSWWAPPSWLRAHAENGVPSPQIFRCNHWSYFFMVKLLTRQCPVLLCPPLRTRPSLSSPAISNPVFFTRPWSFIVLLMVCFTMLLNWKMNLLLCILFHHTVNHACYTTQKLWLWMQLRGEA